MKAETFYFEGKEQLQVHVYKWMPEDGTIKGIVQIAHGMAETAARYERFANYLTQNGYVVYANDHRGHGKTANELENLGYLGKRAGFQYLIEDMYTLTKIIKNSYPDMPIFLFGHSMGSFATQEYIMHYGECLKGAILSGSNGKQGVAVDAGLLVAKREIKKHGRKAQSSLLDKLIFGSYNKQFKPNRTNFDWLSRDHKEVDKYIQDPYCGTIFTAGFFYDLLSELKYIEEKENIYKIPKQLPIYIFSGNQDPVGKNGKGIVTLFKAYQDAGLRHASYKLYEGGRHEMLNEVNRDEVMADVLAWIEKWNN
ncbi:MAG: lysophospholipase [Cellulosilyticaceae bacterium]